MNSMASLDRSVPGYLFFAAKDILCMQSCCGKSRLGLISAHLTPCSLGWRFPFPAISYPSAPGEEEKHVYLVMECCEGGDIGERAG